jgi:hypothetical protein
VSIENSHGINTVRATWNVISNINTIYRLQFVHLRWFWNCGNYKEIVSVLYFQSKIICCWRRKSYITYQWYDTFLDWLKEGGKFDDAITWHYVGLPLFFEQKENISNMRPLHDAISYHYVQADPPSRLSNKCFHLRRFKDFDI